MLLRSNAEQAFHHLPPAGNPYFWIELPPISINIVYNTGGSSAWVI